jgi:ABC-2 type transport system permease protein
MSTATAVSAQPRASALSAPGIIRSEWIKLRTVRSTVWAFAIVILVSVGIALLMAVTSIFEGTDLPADQQTSIVLQVSTFGVYFGQLVMAVLGVLVISGEYSTGMIRSTLTAVPKRVPALAAKAVVLFLASFVVGAVSVFASYLVAAPLLAGQGVTADLSDGSLTGGMLLAALYLALTSVFALGVGTVLRSSAGGIAAALGIVLLLPIVITTMGFTGAEWANDLSPYLFSNAGSEMYAPAGGPLEQWQSGLVVLGWVVVGLGAGALLLKRRDA